VVARLDDRWSEREGGVDGRRGLKRACDEPDFAFLFLAPYVWTHVTEPIIDVEPLRLTELHLRLIHSAVIVVNCLFT
jgi:hypothetical protein